MSIHQAKKRFGQNFLHDAQVLRQIVGAVQPKPRDAIVEIGPGQGALTAGLIAGAGQLTAIELDRDLLPRLQRRFGEAISLRAADVLTVDFGALADELSAQGRSPFRVVGNLPYNISSPILFHLLPWADRIADQTFMLQREVVDRMVAPAGSKTFGRLSVMLQARYVMEKILDVPPEAFDPAPKVWSAVVQMWPLSADRVSVRSWAALETVVTQAFSARRKMVRNTLAPLLSRLDLGAAGISETDRPEAVTVAAYIALANQLADHPQGAQAG